MLYVPHTLSSILSPDPEFWQSLSTNPTQVPWNTKREVISAFLLIKRSEEELNLLDAEMEHVLQYYIQCKECIIHQLDTMKDEPQSLYTSGVMALLHKLLWEVELHYSKAVQCSHKLIHLFIQPLQVVARTHLKLNLTVLVLVIMRACFE